MQYDITYFQVIEAENEEKAKEVAQENAEMMAVMPHAFRVEPVK